MKTPAPSENAGGDTTSDLWEEAAACGACGSRRERFSDTIAARRYAVCLDCGVERLYDRIAEHQLDLLYGSYYASGIPSPDALEEQLANPTFAHRRRRLERCLDDRARRILEIGCGDGNFLATLRRAGWAVHGQEVSADTAAVVARRHGIQVIVGPLEAVPPDRTFPVVGAYHVFEHVYHPAAWLQRVRDLIDAKGLLHLQVPNGGSITRRLSGRVWSGLIFPEHVYFYDPRTLRALVTRFGFTVLTMTTWDPWHGPGTVAASVTNAAKRLLTGRERWSDRVFERPDGALAATSAPVVRRPLKIVLRAGFDWTSRGFARAEAALGRGAVVDIVARRD